MAKVDVGDPAPDFELPGTGGKTYRLAGPPRRRRDPRLLPGRLHPRLHRPVLLLPRRGRPHRRPRDARPRHLAAVGRLARALGRGAAAQRARCWPTRTWRSPRRTAPRAGPRRWPAGRAARRHSGRVLRQALDLRRRRRSRRPLPPRRTSPAPASRQSRTSSGRSPASPDAVAGGGAVRRRVGACAPRRADRRGPGGRPLPRPHRDPRPDRARLPGAAPQGASRRRLRRARARGVGPGPGGRRVMDTRAWSRTWGESSPRRSARARSSSPGTRWAPTRPSPTRSRTRSGSAGLVLIGPVYRGIAPEEAMDYWDGLADGLEEGGVEGFLAALERGGLDPEWRDTVLRFTRRADGGSSPSRGCRRRAARGAALAAVRVDGRAGVPRSPRARRRQPRRRRSRAPARVSPRPTRSGCRRRG